MRFRDIVAPVVCLLLACAVGWALHAVVQMRSQRVAALDRQTEALDDIRAALQDTLTVRVVFRYVPAEKEPDR